MFRAKSLRQRKKRVLNTFLSLTKGLCSKCWNSLRSLTTVINLLTFYLITVYSILLFLLQFNCIAVPFLFHFLDMRYITIEAYKRGNVLTTLKIQTCSLFRCTEIKDVIIFLIPKHVPIREGTNPVEIHLT